MTPTLLSTRFTFIYIYRNSSLYQLLKFINCPLLLINTLLFTYCSRLLKMYVIYVSYNVYVCKMKERSIFYELSRIFFNNR